MWPAPDNSTCQIYRAGRRWFYATHKGGPITGWTCWWPASSLRYAIYFHNQRNRKGDKT